MGRYRFTQDYRSSYGIGDAGDVVEFDDDEQAAAINRDSPGTLEPMADDPKARAPEHPPADRMVKSARRRQDRQGDPSDQEAMSRADHKAVRD